MAATSSSPSPPTSHHDLMLFAGAKRPCACECPTVEFGTYLRVDPGPRRSSPGRLHMIEVHVCTACDLVVEIERRGPDGKPAIKTFLYSEALKPLRRR